MNLDRFEDHAAFSERERLVLRLTHLMAETPVEISDEFFARLKKHFSDQQLEELASAIALENYLARSNRVFRIESDGFSAGHLCPLPVRHKS